jgi:hypothetical protein
VINYLFLFWFVRLAIIEPIFPIILSRRHDMLHSLDAALQVFISPFQSLNGSLPRVRVASPASLIGITGSGFINRAASRYNPMAGKKPAAISKIMAIILAQKTEKSKCSANPLHTPRIMPLRER